MAVPFHFSIRTRLVSVANHKKLMRKLNRQALARIRDLYWPRHFQVRPETRPGGAYGYEKRSRQWQIKKAAVKRHQKPLVWSGQSAIQIRQNARITATANRGRLRSSTHYRRNAARIREMEAVSSQEQRELAARAGRDYARLAQRPEYKSQRALRK